jgi:hypothetical protein
MFIFIVQELDYDHCETHRIAFYNKAEAEKYAAKVKADLNDKQLETYNSLKDIVPNLDEGYGAFPKTSSVHVEVIELELSAHCPE